MLAAPLAVAVVLFDTDMDGIQLQITQINASFSVCFQILLDRASSTLTQKITINASCDHFFLDKLEIFPDSVKHWQCIFFLMLCLQIGRFLLFHDYQR